MLNYTIKKSRKPLSFISNIASLWATKAARRPIRGWRFWLHGRLLSSGPSILLLTTILLANANAHAQAKESMLPPVEFPKVLTLEQAMEIFRSHGFDLLIADTAVQSAQGDLKAAAAIPNPSLGILYGLSSCGGAANCPGLVSISASDQAALFDTLSGKRRLRQDVARLALQATKMARADAQRLLGSQVKQQFIQVLVARKALQLARELAQTTARTFELTNTRYKFGSVSEADVARAETARLEAEQVVDLAAQNLMNTRFGLAYLLGVRGNAPDFEVEGPEMMRLAIPEKLSGATRESLLAQALEQRPDLKAARLQQERAAAQLTLAKRQRLSDISLNLSFSEQGTGIAAITPPTATIGISAPIPVFYRQQGEIERANADLRSQIVQAAKTEGGVASDIEIAYSSFTGAERLMRRMEGGLLDRARRARDLVQIQYQKGAASLLELLDAQRTLGSTYSEYLQDLTAYWTSLFKLEQAVGMELQ